MTDQKDYGYGHTKESAAIVRNELKTQLSEDIKKYGLKISVRKADSGYGGPRVEITTPCLELDKRYEYIVDENGQPSNRGTIVSKPVSEFKWGRPCGSAELVTPAETKQLNDRITNILCAFGRDNDDAMIDYFDNTQPLFYGVEVRQ